MPKSMKEQLEAQKAAKALETSTQREAAVAATEASEPVIKDAAASGSKPPVAANPDTLQARIDEAVQRALKSVAIAAPKAFDEEALGRAIAKGLALQQATKEYGDHEKRLTELKKKQEKEEKCHLCGQSVGNGRTSGCGGPHRRDAKGNYVMEPVLNPDMTPVIGDDDKPVMKRIEDYDQFHEKCEVFPRDAMALQCWDGVTINSKTYMSAGPGHKVWIPKFGKGAIMAALSEYERGEREARIPKKRNRFAGSMSANGAHSGPGVGAGWNTESA